MFGLDGAHLLFLLFLLLPFVFILLWPGAEAKVLH
jgi:hypothetical protein